MTCFSIVRMLRYSTQYHKSYAMKSNCTVGSPHLITFFYSPLTARWSTDRDILGGFHMKRPIGDVLKVSKRDQPWVINGDQTGKHVIFQIKKFMHSATYIQDSTCKIWAILQLCHGKNKLQFDKELDVGSQLTIDSLLCFRYYLISK